MLPLAKSIQRFHHQPIGTTTAKFPTLSIWYFKSWPLKRMEAVPMHRARNCSHFCYHMLISLLRMQTMSAIQTKLTIVFTQVTALLFASPPAESLQPEGRKQHLLKDMLEKNTIQPSNSPWASPIVLVKKKNGALRFCVDYRKLNAVTRKDAYPLPRVDDTLDTLAHARWFTTLDLISGYWQVAVHPDDREKNAFCTPNGLFEFKVMPFGLCNAPATFQRLMDSVLAGLQWSTCLVYLDDIIIVGKTFADHLNNLRQVFDRIRGAGLKLQPAKCVLCTHEVTFLGHIVSAAGITTDPSKTDKVTSWPTPTTKREVQQFLGLANYYRRFIKHFASIAKPLHRLTEKTASFKWTTECQTAFETLKHTLTSAPILAHPDYSKEFILDTDASAVGIGAVLSQVQSDGNERPIAYASRTLSKPERCYCVTQRELLAVVTFIKHFRPYLLGRSFHSAPIMVL